MENRNVLNLIIVNVVALLVPLLPVVILYLLFGKLNYFGLDGTWKSIVGAGPIAAYIFLYVITLRHIPQITRPLIAEKRVRQLEQVESTQVPDIQGTWIGTWPWQNPETGQNEDWKETVQVSQHGRHVTGTIRDTDGQNSRFTGSIFSRMLTFYYVSETNSRISCGSVTVRIDPYAKSMEGHQIYYDLDLEKLIPTPYKLELSQR